MGSGFNMALANFVWDKKISAKEFGDKLLHEIPYGEELEIVECHHQSNDDSKIAVFFKVNDGTEYKMADMRDTYSNEESYVEFLKLMMLKNIDDKKRSFENMNDYINIRPVSLDNVLLNNEFSSLFK